MSETLPVPPPRYTTRDCAAADARATVLGIWRANLRDPERHAAKFDWAYTGCAFGEPLLQLLQLAPSREAVGACAIGRRPMLQDGRPIRAGVLVDMAVGAAHRSLGPAMIMQDGLLAAARESFDFVYGFPGPRALPVVQRLGYSVLGYLPRYSCVLRHARYLGRHVPWWLARPAGALVDAVYGRKHAARGADGARWTTMWADRVDPRMDALWRQSRHPDGIIAPRDTTFLRWRFDASPTHRTRYLLVSTQPDDRLLAWFACRATDRTLQVCDFWSEDAAGGIGLAYIRALLRSARRDGHDAATLACCAPPARMANWLAAGFVERERRPVVGTWLHGAPGPVAAAVALQLTTADEDD